jgi:hypothetical protein
MNRAPSARAALAIVLGPTLVAVLVAVLVRLFLPATEIPTAPSSPVPAISGPPFVTPSPVP